MGRVVKEERENVISTNRERKNARGNKRLLANEFVALKNYSNYALQGPLVGNF